VDGAIDDGFPLGSGSAPSDISAAQAGGIVEAQAHCGGCRSDRLTVLSTACDLRLARGDRVASDHGDPRVFPTAVSWQFWRSIQNGTTAVSRKLEEPFPPCLARAKRPARSVDISVQEVEHRQPVLRAWAGARGGATVDGHGRRPG
jgi:hypothetical protein